MDNEISLKSKTLQRVKDPIPFPKIQGVYEKDAEAIFSVQTNDMIIDITKEIVKILK